MAAATFRNQIRETKGGLLTARFERLTSTFRCSTSKAMKRARRVRETLHCASERRYRLNRETLRESSPCGGGLLCGPPRICVK